MSVTETDVVVAGAGLAGLACTLRLARAGLNVTLVDPRPADAAPSDQRSTAFLQPAQALLARLGLWERLAPAATPLASLRVIDAGGTPPLPRQTRLFHASDLGPDPFAWNLPNETTRRAMLDACEAHAGITLRLGRSVTRLLTRTTEARVTLDDGGRIAAALVVAADGRDSTLRGLAGISVTTRRHGQKALAFSVTHERPHDNVSTEVYHSGGAFTLVPLADRKGRPASAVVWMDDARAALDRRGLPPNELGRAATERSTGILGALLPVTPVGLFPVVTQRAQAMTARRLVLIAEAAHVLPPIGAQGLNASLLDVAALGGLAEDARLPPGGEAFTRAFARAREADIAARTALIDAYNRLCQSGAAPARALRSGGLALAHDIAPLRHALMQAGLGGPVALTAPTPAVPRTRA